MIDISFPEIGLPVFPGGDEWVAGLAYNPSSATLISTVASGKSVGCRLFLRGQHEASYRELNPPESGLTFDRCLAMASDAPVAFVMVLNVARGASALFVVSLPDGQLTPMPGPTSDPKGRLWVSRLLASSPDGAWLHVVVAEQSPSRADGGHSYIYSVARMEVSTGQVEKIVELPTPFA